MTSRPPAAQATSMVSPRLFVDELVSRGFGPFIGVPCSFLRPFIDYVISRRDLEYVGATNEGEALAVAVGTYLGGRKPVVMFQNSGLGNLVNPLASLALTFRAPALLICTWRGQPGLADEPQHEAMGAATPGLFDLLQVPNEEFPDRDEEIAGTLDRVDGAMNEHGLPYALILPKGRVAPLEPSRSDAEDENPLDPVAPRHLTRGGEKRALRKDAIRTVVDTVRSDSVVVATTGKTGRELFELEDRPGNFYMVGSMGCAPSVALGICLTHSTGPVVVLDGDGALLMRLESLASVGHWRPANLVHVVLDNGTYDSTGGQTTIARSVSFAHVAAACGYRSACTLDDLGDLASELQTASNSPGPHLIHVRIRPGSDPSLGRPTISPPEVARRLRERIRELRHAAR